MYLFAYKATERGIRQRHIAQIVEATKPAKRPPLFVQAIAETTDEIDRSAGSRMLRRNGMPEWAIAIVLEVADRRAICVPDIASRKRSYPIMEARRESMYLIKASHPDLSMALLGKWFAKDATSVTHLVACHQEIHRLPKLVGYNLAKVRARDKIRKVTLLHGSVR